MVPSGSGHNGELSANEKSYLLSILTKVDENNVFKKMFWVSQGISMVEKNELKNIQQNEEIE